MGKKNHNAGEEKDVKLDQDKMELARKQELEDIKQIINTKAGERFFKRVMDHAHIFCTTFTGNSQGYFLEGERNLALMFFKDIAAVAPEKVRGLVINEEQEED